MRHVKHKHFRPTAIIAIVSRKNVSDTYARLCRTTVLSVIAGALESPILNFTGVFFWAYEEILQNVIALVRRK
jgi:hypothetical protein